MKGKQSETCCSDEASAYGIVCIIEREFLHVRMTCRLWVIMMERGSCTVITQDLLRQLAANIPFCELVRGRLALNRHTSN